MLERTKFGGASNANAASATPPTWAQAGAFSASPLGQYYAGTQAPEMAGGTASSPNFLTTLHNQAKWNQQQSAQADARMTPTQRFASGAFDLMQATGTQQQPQPQFAPVQFGSMAPTSNGLMDSIAALLKQRPR